MAFSLENTQKTVKTECLMPDGSIVKYDECGQQDKPISAGKMNYLCSGYVYFINGVKNQSPYLLNFWKRA